MPLIASELVAALSPKHPVFARRRNQPESLRWGALRGATLLVHDIGEVLYARLDNAVRESWLRESGERLGSPFTLQKIPLTEALVELARARAGVAIVYCWTVEPYLGRDLVALPITPRAPRTFKETGFPSALPLMSQSAMSIPLIAWIATPRRPRKMAPRYFFCHRRSTSSGSSPDQEITQSPGEGVRRRRVDDCPRDLRRRVDLADAVDALVRSDANDQVVLAAIGDRAVEARLRTTIASTPVILMRRLLGSDYQ